MLTIVRQKNLVKLFCLAVVSENGRCNRQESTIFFISGAYKIKNLKIRKHQRKLYQLNL